MERTLSPEERIRRAEEVYYRRRNESTDKKTATVNVGRSPNFKLLKRIFVQIIVCLIIYLLFNNIRNSNHVFSTNILDKTNKILSYDINFEAIYQNSISTIQKFSTKTNGTDRVTEEIKGKVSEEGILENNTEDIITPVVTPEENEEKTDLQAFMVPLKGTITSRFGEREATSSVVSPYHTGIDIAANAGTIFIAAMAGTVTEISSEGGYGNHIKITNGNITTLYAHCSNIYVKEGENIELGQEIAEVGETRKRNRSTFTF